MKILILTTILLSISIFTFYATAEEELTGTLNVDFASSTAVYTEASVKTTVTVPENWCNTCIKMFQPSQCLEACDVIYVN